MSLTPPDSRRTSENGCHDDALSMTDLASRFSHHSLHSRRVAHLPSTQSLFSPDFEISPFTTRPPTPPADLPTPGPFDDAPEDCSPTQSYFSFRPRRQASWGAQSRSSDVCAVSASRTASTYASSSNASIRSQRQRSVRRQCSSAHIEEIRALVARMVANGELCDVHRPSASRADDDSENAMIMDDDDVDECDDDQDDDCCASPSGSSRRQSCAFAPPTTSSQDRGSSCCVSKSARLRRRGRRRGAMSVY